VPPVRKTYRGHDFYFGVSLKSKKRPITYFDTTKRGARIYGEICGYGSTCDAYHITAPHPEAEGGARAMKQALTEAGYRGTEKVYVNAHGTGTPMNDSSETLAIKKALGEEQACAIM